MFDVQPNEGSAPLSTTRPVLSPSFMLIGAAIAAVVLLLTFRLITA
jgi:hypothetical protein